MVFVASRELRIRPKAVWKRLAEDREVIITSNGQPIALLTPVKPETLEEDLAVLRRTRALAALERIHRKALKTGKDKMTDEQIEAVIERYRKAQRR
jgi:prevent-host-death family protein